MRGEPITFENIKKILEESKEPVRKAGNTLLKIFVIIAKVFFGLFIGFFAFIFIIILFALISSVFALSTVPFSMLPISLSYLPLIGSPGQMAIAIGALIFTLGIPIYSIIRGVAGWIFNLPKQRNWVSVLLLILWIIGIFGTLVLFGTNLSSFFWHIQNS